jgi:hypothetical protein
MLSKIQNIICTLLKKIQMNLLKKMCIVSLTYICWYLFLKILTNFWFLKNVKMKTFKRTFFSKVQIIFWLSRKHSVLEPYSNYFLLVLILSLLFFFNFCLLWVSFIYWYSFGVVVCLVDYLILFLFIFCLTEFFTFFKKKLFCGKCYFNKFKFVLYWHSLFQGERLSLF